MKSALIEPYTRGHLSRGRDNRLFVNAVLYRVRTGTAWRDLPERFGAWNTVARRFRRWAVAGVWEQIFRALQEPDYERVLVDSTTVKAHKAAAGQKKLAPGRRPRSQPGRLLDQTARRGRCAG